MSITGGQIRAARGFLQWTAAELAEKSNVGLSTVRRAEDSAGVPALTKANLGAIRGALEVGGIEFIPENGGGEGVRLRNGASPQAERAYRSVGPESEVRGGPEAAERPEIETDD
jgi:hypothetical protein